MIVQSLRNMMITSSIFYLLLLSLKLCYYYKFETNHMALNIKIRPILINVQFIIVFKVFYLPIF